MAISPGVYSKIIDLSTYLAEVPASTGFIAGLTEKGPDNKATFVGSRSELISQWGEPNISHYNKNFGQGLYNAYNFLGESGSLYFLRCLPDDAAFSNIRLDATEATDTTSTISITYVEEVNTKEEINSNIAANSEALCFLYPVGRGEYYNNIGIRITEYSNTMISDVYVMDIYEKQSDGDDVIIESFDISFDPNAVDTAGDSLFIEYILNSYSSVLRADMAKTNGDWSDGFTNVVKVFDKNIGLVSLNKTDSGSLITDNKQVFTDWEQALSVARFIITARDGTGNKMWGWLGNSTGVDDVSCEVWKDKAMTSRGWNDIGEDDDSVALFDEDSLDIIYSIKKNYGNIYQPFTSSEPIPMKKGSDGNLKDADGSINTTNATTLLAQGYAGIIDEDILDTENFNFNLVFDCGYPSDVKTQINSLVTTRRDCIGILDNGDNATYNLAMSTRLNTHMFNNYFVALYESYNKVYDPFTGQDVWFSPIYHMSYLIPRNDAVGEIWYAAAGFTRGSIDSIKELRYNPRIGQRDQMYLRQLNPVVKFLEGIVVWGQLTAQAKPSTLQDLNCVRLVLYCEKAISNFCKFFIFDQNDAVTWSLISGQIVEFLENIKKKRGLDSYSVSVYTTEYLRKRKTCAVDIILQPTKALEKIELNFFVK